MSIVEAPPVRIKREDGDVPPALAALQQPPDLAPATRVTPPPAVAASSSNPAELTSTTTTVLFTEPKSFATDQAFFREVRSRLMSVYGVGSRPSKRKPTRISARCVRHKDADCPFRVCAAKNGSTWTILLHACVWNHSHPPGPDQRPVNAAIGAEGSSPLSDLEPQRLSFTDRSPPLVTPRASPAYPPHRAPPAYPAPGTKFDSPTEVFHAYVRAAVTALGVSVHWEKGTIRCDLGDPLLGPTPGGCCGFNIVVKRDRISKCWMVDSAASEHGHNHGMHPALMANPQWRPDLRNPEARRALGMPLLAAQKRTTSETIDLTSTSDWAIHAATPKPGEVFASLDEIYLAFMKAYIPTTGIGVFKISAGHPCRGQLRCNRASKVYQCPWAAIVVSPRPGQAVIDPDRSHLKHNHGRHPMIIADPTWRPVVRNPGARRALDLVPISGPPPKASSTQKRTSTAASLPPPPPPKRQQSASQLASPAPTRTAPPALSHSGDSAPPVLAATAGISEHPIPPSRPLQPLRLSTPASLETRAPSSLPPPAVAGRASATPQQHSDTVARPPLPSLHAFLHGLHPASAPLAPHLVAAGVVRTRDLVAMLNLEPEIFERFAGDLIERVTDSVTKRALEKEKGNDTGRTVRMDTDAVEEGGGEPAVSVVQVKLFVAKMREARAGLRSGSLWTTER